MAWKVENAAIRSVRATSQREAEQIRQIRQRTLGGLQKAREVLKEGTDVIAILSDASSQFVKIITAKDMPFVPWNGHGTLVATQHVGLEVATRKSQIDFHHERWLERLKAMPDLGWVPKQLAPAQDDRLPFMAIGKLGGEGIRMEDWKQLGRDEENAGLYKLVDGRFAERDIAPGFQSS